MTSVGTFTIAEGSDVKLREAYPRAFRRFAAANPNLNAELLLAVAFTHAVDFMWTLAQSGTPRGGASVEATFRELLQRFATEMIEGKHLVSLTGQGGGSA